MADSDLDLKILRLLGEGSFGKVYLVAGSKNESEKYAMKVISLAKATQEEREDAEREAKLLSCLNHENIISYVEAFEQNGKLCILTEYCDGGDMGEVLEKQNGVPLPENCIVQWLKQICFGLQYLHTHHILHRDLKTQNIYLTGPEKKIKLGDLGLARVLEHPGAKAITFCGSPFYMSPEMFQLKPYDAKSDIWALGVCVYEMTTLERPFDALLMQHLVSKIVHDQLPDMPSDKYSTELISLMTIMMDKNAENRPSAETILGNSIFKTSQKGAGSKPVPRVKPDAKAKTPAKPKPRQNVFEQSTGENLLDVFKKARGMADSASVSDSKEIGELLISMSQLLSKRNQKQDEKLSPILAATHIEVNIKADKYSDKNKDINKTVKGKKGSEGSSKNATLTPQNVHRNPSSDSCFIRIFEQQQRNHNRIRNVVVHTLTTIIHREPPKGATGRSSCSSTLTGSSSQVKEEDPEANILQQIACLQQYCAAVLDENLLNQAYALLDAYNDNTELEAKLIQLLTPEKFALCGSQLMYCKNFEYSLAKLENEKKASGH